MPKFDVVVGNPPYQDSNKVAKNSNLWTKFIKIGFNMVKTEGYLTMITPDTWFAPTETQFKEIKIIVNNNNLIFLNKDVKKYFKGIGASFAAFTIQKDKNKNNTLIKLEDGSEIKRDIQKYPLIPKILNIKSLSILEKVLFSGHEKLEFSSSQRVDVGPKNEDKSGSNKVIISKGQIINTKVPASKNKNIKKVVVSKISYLYPIFDDGKCSTSSYCYWVPIRNENEAKSLINFLDSKLSKFIFNKICRYTGFNSLGVLKQLPKIDLSKEWSDEELYEYFNLTQEEIDYIENSVKE